MPDPVLTVSIPPELAQELDRLSEQTHRDRSDLVTDAITAFVAQEQAVAAEIRRGLEDARAGRTVAHTVAMERIRAAIHKR